MSMIAHPMTLGNDGNPKYSARDFRNMLDTFLAPSDGSGPINTVIEGVKLTSDQPICTVSGRTATIKTHIGILNPYPSAGPYTYYSSDMPVTLPNTTESWKIAVLVDDPSEGHGSTPQVRLDTYPASTPDSNIPGMVLALVHNGVADDIAPRLLINPTVVVNDLDQLNTITAVNGQQARLRNSSAQYEYNGGSWICTYRAIAFPAITNTWWHTSELKLVKINDIVHFSTKIRRDSNPWTDTSVSTFTTDLPSDMRPSQSVWAFIDPRFGLFLDFDATGKVLWGRDSAYSFATMGVGSVVDVMGSYVLGMGPIRS